MRALFYTVLTGSSMKVPSVRDPEQGPWQPPLSFLLVAVRVHFALLGIVLSLFQKVFTFSGLMNSAAKFSVVQGRGFRGTRRFAFWFCLAFGALGLQGLRFV